MKNLLVILSFLIGGILSAQEFYVDIESSNDYPGVGENFKVVYTLKLKSNSFSMSGRIGINRDKSEIFTIVQERSSGVEMSFGFDNEITLKTLTQVLKPTKQGDYILPTVEFILGDTKVKSNPYEIHVGKAKPKIEVAENTDYFARIKLNKYTAYIGEPIMASYYIYTKYKPQDAAINTPTSNQNFWTEELSNNLKLDVETVNGSRYYALDCKKVILFPQKSGKLNIDAFLGQLQILKQRKRSLFPDFEVLDVKSNSPSVKVLPLPNNAKSSFVGNYSVSMSTSTSKTSVNEGFDLKITIKGSGNLKRINELDLNLPSDFEVYDPEITENLTLTSKGYKGTKTFNYLVIPKAAGVFDIEGFRLDYFIPSSKELKTVSAPDYTITVEKGSLSQNNVLRYKSNKQKVELLDNDIRYIKTDSNWEKENKVFYTTWWFWLSLTLPLLALIHLNFTKPILDKKKFKADQTKNALQILNGLELNDSNLLSKVYNAWQIVLCEKLSINVSEFNQKILNEKLANSQHKSEVLSILNQIEMANYSPISSSELSELVSRSKALIQRLRNEV